MRLPAFRESRLRLTDLLEGIRITLTALDAERLEITGLAADSRKVEPGFLFAALPGSRADGVNFVGEAVRRGAAAVLAPKAAEASLRLALDQVPPVVLICDPNPRRLFALMAARFFGRQPETVAAVTGTNGKTSVVSFLRQIWTAAGRQAASLGTLGLTAPGRSDAGSMTTPDPVALHRMLSSLVDAGVQCLAMEASSHGLDQCRLDGVRIAAGAFTTLGRDHLDYHPNIEAYLSAKLRLFDALVVDGGAAVICADDLAAGRVRSAAAARGLRVLTYGRRGEDLRLRGINSTADGQQLAVTIAGQDRLIELPLAGDFQALNALCALGLALATGTDAELATAALGRLEAVRGRLERVARVGGASIYVDYAHTPDALAVVLRALRPQVRRELAVVFGCGGDRDPGKRPQMGEVARQFANRIVVTDDNPRSEEASAIRRQILAACPNALEIGDRAEAIAAAISALQDGDVLVVAGKGHETGQVVGDQVLPFDDAAVIRHVVGETAW